MPTTSLPKLVSAVERGGVAVASSWSAVHHLETAEHPEHVEVLHYVTPMFAVVLTSGHGWRRGDVLPISSGRGSQTDRCGVRRILQGYGIAKGYRDLYDGADVPPEHTGWGMAPSFPRRWDLAPEAVAA